MNSAGTAVQEYEEGQEHAQSGKDKLYSEVDGQGKQGKARKPYTITKARERWTDNEPARFLEGLSLFGRSWGKVAQHVQTKTTIQIRSHAQKYFNRVKKQQECQPSSTTWQAGSDRSNAYLQSWQTPASTAPASTSIGGTSEPFQRAAEIVAAAATEAAAAAASVVVSTASRRIKEQLEKLYCVQHVEGAPAPTAALTDGTKAPADSAFTQDGMAGNMHAPNASEEGTDGTPQKSMVNSMQSIESAIVSQAMQRISSLFQHEKVHNSGGIDAKLNIPANKPANKAAARQTGWLPGSGGSSAFVPLGKDAASAQDASEGRVTGNAPAAPSQMFPTLHQPPDGTVCGDSDVVGDVQKEVNSGGGTSQAFSEVGVDGNSKQATPTKAAVATKSGSGAPEDSGSSHVYEPPRKRIAVQGRDNAGPVPATSAPGGSATSRAPTAHVAQTGGYAIAAQQHMVLAQSLQKRNRDGVTPEGVLGSLGQTLQSLSPIELATQTFECLAPTSGGHASDNAPSCNGLRRGMSLGNGLSNGTGLSNGMSKGGTSNTNGIVSNGMTSNMTCHHSNSSIANGSNGTSIITYSVANCDVPVFTHVPSTNLNGNSWSNMPRNGVLTPDQLLTAERAAQKVQAAVRPNATTQPAEEPNKAKQQVKGQPASQPALQAVQLPLTAVQPQPQLPAWALHSTGAPQANAAFLRPFAAVPALPQAVMQAELLAVGVSAAGKLPHNLQPGMLAQPALCGVQPQPSASSTPMDATAMGWWPPGMSMQNLVNLMVGSQMTANFNPAHGDVAKVAHTNSGHQIAHEPIDAAARVYAEGS